MPDQQGLLPNHQAAAGRPAQPAEQQVVLQRLASVDTFRGLVLFLMVAEIFLQLHTVGKALPEGRFWQFLRHHQTHVIWEGASLHDLRVRSPAASGQPRPSLGPAKSRPADRARCSCPETPSLEDSARAAHCMNCSQPATEVPRAFSHILT